MRESVIMKRCPGILISINSGIVRMLASGIRRDLEFDSKLEMLQ
jgi:hypothetical protein